MYIPISGHPCFSQKINNVSTLTTTNNMNYTNHKPSHEYRFDLNHIVMPCTGPTHNIFHVQTHLQNQTHTHIYMYELAYAQPSPYIHTSTNLNTHSHGLTHTYIYVHTQEHSVPDIFLSFHNMQSILRL